MQHQQRKSRPPDAASAGDAADSATAESVTTHSNPFALLAEVDGEEEEEEETELDQRRNSAETRLRASDTRETLWVQAIERQKGALSPAELPWSVGEPLGRLPRGGKRVQASGIVAFAIAGDSRDGEEQQQEHGKKGRDGWSGIDKHNNGPNGPNEGRQRGVGGGGGVKTDDAGGERDDEGASSDDDEDDDALDRVMLLLGREAHRPNFGGGGQWSDFGGAIKSGAVDTWACKEFFEETMGSVYAARNKLLLRIRSGDVSVVVDAFVPDSKTYRAYVVRLPHVNYPGVFRRRQQASWQGLRVHLPQLFRQNGRLRPEAQEKDELRWVSMREALRGDLPLRPEFAQVLRGLAESGWARKAVQGRDFLGCSLDAQLPSGGSVEVHGRFCPCDVDASVAAPGTLSAPSRGGGGGSHHRRSRSVVSAPRLVTDPRRGFPCAPLKPALFPSTKTNDPMAQIRRLARGCAPCSSSAEDFGRNDEEEDHGVDVVVLRLDDGDTGQEGEAEEEEGEREDDSFEDGWSDVVAHHVEMRRKKGWSEGSDRVERRRQRRLDQSVVVHRRPLFLAAQADRREGGAAEQPACSASVPSQQPQQRVRHNQHVLRSHRPGIPRRAPWRDAVAHALWEQRQKMFHGEGVAN